MTPGAHRWLPTASASVGLVVAYALLPLTGRDRSWGVALGSLLLVATVPYVAVEVRSVLRGTAPFQDAVAAVVVVSTMAVVGPAATYYGLAAAGGHFEGLATKVDALYFTMSIVSTVGFGDIRPVGQGARLVTTLHIVVTIVVVGGAVRLLTWAARHRMTGGGSDRA
ncbi:potassium channel family protein [Actinomarinicola tropica]|uniref:potassium channel family protein n=1 Tax=Actinomarinicola tropica TaxID=2789776 RepID=UPI0018993A92|nr:potassium channel family protein [Actinomarinicola tropica]